MAVWESTAVQDLFCTCHSKIYQQYHRVCKSLTVLTGASHRSFLYGPHVHILKYMDKTKTEIWENKPLTQRMLLLNPSAVPHLSRLQPPLGSASWIEGGQWTCSLWSQWKWTQPCPQVLREHAEWLEAILLHFKAPGQPERIPSECFSSWNRRRYRDITLRYMQPYLGEQEEKQLLQLAKWDKKFSAAVYVITYNV